ncbi:hypothetical protein CK203_082390 [Vitis vinifera]|uniref:Reverse transcriptase zinc-binding domain-containing protein n=1 Tax=Vitis vinifera TaxID=29760 RepID=A0A438DSI8_VITVI|nr:hypothetical protein CK203_082390 [Vitis vinifera]
MARERVKSIRKGSFGVELKSFDVEVLHSLFQKEEELRVVGFQWWTLRRLGFIDREEGCQKEEALLLKPNMGKSTWKWPELGCLMDEKKERGLGAYCGITRFLMGSGHSEKDRRGVRGLPRSRFPNGEAEDLQWTRILVKLNDEKPPNVVESGNIVGTEGEAIARTIEPVRGKDDSPRLEDLLRLVDGTRGSPSPRSAEAFVASRPTPLEAFPRKFGSSYFKLPSLKDSGRAKEKEPVGPFHFFPLGVRKPVETFGRGTTFRGEFKDRLCSNGGSFEYYDCSEAGSEKFQRESPGRMVIGKEFSVMETVTRWELMEVNNGNTEESGEELCLASATPLEVRGWEETSWEESDLARRRKQKVQCKEEGARFWLSNEVKETKIQTMSEGVVRSLGSGRFLDWGAGCSRLCGWDFDMLGQKVPGIAGDGGRKILCGRARAIRGIWDDPWFAQVVDDLELLDLLCKGVVLLDGGAGRRGRANFRLAAKLKGLSERETLKNEAKETFKKWVLLEETHWRQLSRELWLKEGDKNTRFFHRMPMPTGETTLWIESRSMGWSWMRSRSEAEALEMPFTEEEIFLALMEMNGDKAPGLDGFTVAFWQSCWDFVKRRLKKVLGKVVSAIKTFVRGRQILDASLIANEVVDYWQKQKKKGLVCKLDIEKAYDSINWNFLMKKASFPARGCIKDPISPYLFVLGMEVLSALIRRALMGASFLEEHLTHLGWILAWFEAALGLRINLAKSELIPVGEVEDIEEMVGVRKVIGVKYGQEGCGWRTNEARGTFGVGVWKEILKEASWCWDNIEFKVGRGLRSSSGLTIGAATQRVQNFPSFMPWRRVASFAKGLQISSEEDSVLWKGGGLDIFRIRDAYNLLAAPNPLVFPKKSIWVDKVPTKVAFFAWEATWEKILTLDRLQNEGGSSLIVVICVAVKRKM